METLKIKIAEKTTETLKETATLLMSNFADGSQMVFDLILAELETRMPESDFIAFCDSL